VDLFDDVTVLSSGKLMYHGSMDNLEGHFENKLGQKCPRGHNILEFVIDLISVDASTPETMLESEKLIAEVAKHASRKMMEPKTVLVVVTLLMLSRRPQ